MNHWSRQCKKVLCLPGLCLISIVTVSACCTTAPPLQEKIPDNILSEARQVPSTPTSLRTAGSIGFGFDVVDWLQFDAPAGLHWQGTTLVVHCYEPEAIVELSLYDKELALLDSAIKPAGQTDVAVSIQTPISRVFLSVQALEGETDYLIEKQLPSP